MIHPDHLKSLFESIMAASPDAVIISDASGTIVRASLSAERLFGYSCGRMTGLNVSQLMPGPLASQHDDLIARYQLTGESSLIGKGRIVTAVNATGDEFLIHLTLSEANWLGRTWYLGFCHDLRLRQRVEKDRQRLEVMQEALFEAAADGLITIDQNGFIQSFNPAAQRLFGWSPEEAIGRNVSMLMPAEYAEKHDFYIQRYLSGEPAKIIGIGREVTGLKRDGSTFPMHLSVGEAVYGGASTFIGICHDLSSRKQLLEEVSAARDEAEYLENHDRLTGFLTKEALINQFPGWINTQSGCAVVALSYTRFGIVNQRYGYEAGDIILKALTMRLVTALPDESLLARVSGSHLVVVIPCENSEAVTQAVRDLLALMEEPYTELVEPLQLDARAGVCLYPKDTENITELLQWAEGAMLDASNEMELVFYNTADHARLTRILDIEQRLRTALNEGQFEVYLQPKVQLATGKRVGYEALVRWPLSDGSFISPVEFIPIAEAIGLGKELDRYMINQVVHHQAERRKAGREVLPIAVNVTGPHFSDGSLLNLVCQSLDLCKLSASDLILEITESSLVTPNEDAMKNLKFFKDRGIKIDIDDFGTGYSSLSYLKYLPVSGIKIDKMFVDEILTTSGYQMIAGILAIARSQSLTVTAEGIEQEEQAAALLQLGCEIGQGYWFDRPFPMSDL